VIGGEATAVGLAGLADEFQQDGRPIQCSYFEAAMVGDVPKLVEAGADPGIEDPTTVGAGAKQGVLTFYGLRLGVLDVCH
jgi:hypothetical protein